MDDLLKSTKFSPLMTGFENAPDRQFEPNTKAMEYRHYSFVNENKDFFDNNHIEHLSWFAFNKTDEFAQQVIKKVDKYRKTELSDLLYQINKECQK